MVAKSADEIGEKEVEPQLVSNLRLKVRDAAVVVLDELGKHRNVSRGGRDLKKQISRLRNRFIRNGTLPDSAELTYRFNGSPAIIDAVTDTNQQLRFLLKFFEGVQRGKNGGSVASIGFSNEEFKSHKLVIDLIRKHFGGCFNELMAEVGKVIPKSEAVFKKGLTQAEIELWTKVENGDQRAMREAYDKLHGLIYGFAKQFSTLTSVDYDELVGCGKLGLATGLIRYNHRFGTQPSTYVSPWIKLFMRRFIDRNKYLIHIPGIGDRHEASKIKKKVDKLYEEADGEMDWVDILNGMDVEPRFKKQVYAMRYLSCPSLDNPIGGDDASTFHDIIGEEDEDLTGVISRLHNESISEICKGVILNSPLAEYMPQRMWDIFRRRSLQDPVDTLEQLGTEYKITREMVRQVEKRAIRIIRKSHKVKKVLGLEV